MSVSLTQDIDLTALLALAIKDIDGISLLQAADDLMSSDGEPEDFIDGEYQVEESDNQAALPYESKSGLSDHIFSFFNLGPGQTEQTETQAPENTTESEPQQPVQRTTRSSRGSTRPVPSDESEGSQEPVTPTENAAPKTRSTAKTKTGKTNRGVSIDDLGYDDETTQYIKETFNHYKNAIGYDVTIGGKKYRLPGFPVYSSDPKASNFVESLRTDKFLGFAAGLRKPNANYDENGKLITLTESKKFGQWRTVEFYSPTTLMDREVDDDGNAPRITDKAGKSVYLKNAKLVNNKAGYPPFLVETAKGMGGPVGGSIPAFDPDPNAPPYKPIFDKSNIDAKDSSTSTPSTTPVTPSEPESTPASNRRSSAKKVTNKPTPDAGETWDNFGESEPLNPPESPISYQPPVEPTPVVPTPSPIPVTPRNRPVPEAGEDDSEQVSATIGYSPKHEGIESVNRKITRRLLQSLDTDTDLDIIDLLELAMESTDDAYLRSLLDATIDRLQGAPPKDCLRRIKDGVSGFFGVRTNIDSPTSSRSTRGR